MKISTKSQYGLRAMLYLAKALKRNKFVPLKEISKKEGISFDYLEKIFSKLGRADLVKAKRGVQGGYFLTKNPSKIKVGQIIEALEGELALVKCITKTKKYFCPRTKDCFARNFWKKIQVALDSTLNSVTLADLIKNK